MLRFVKHGLRPKLTPMQSFSSKAPAQEEDTQIEALSEVQETEFLEWLKDESAQQRTENEKPSFVPLETLKDSIKEFNQSKQLSLFDRFKIHAKSNFFNLAGSQDGSFFVDQIQETKYQINIYCKNLQKDQDIDDQLSRISNLLFQSFQQNQYQIIFQKDFQFILQNPHTQPLLAHFNRNFFVANPNFMTNQEISQLMSRVEKNQELHSGLDLISCHKAFLDLPSQQSLFQGDEHAEKFLSTQVKSGKFNYLNFSYHLFKLVQKNIFKKVNQKDLVNQFLNLSLNRSEQFDQAHKELLLVKLNIQLNSSLRYFLFDVFYCNPKFEKACLQYSLALCVLARLKEKEVQLLDLFPFVQNIFYSQFDNYFKNWLPRVLAELPDKSLLKKYEEELEKYQRKESAPLKLITEFDRQLFQKRAFVDFNYEKSLTSPVQFNFNGNKIRFETENSDSTEQSRKEVFKKAMLEKNYKMLGLFIQEQFNQDQELQNNKIDFENPEESIKHHYSNLKTDVQEMLEFEEPPKVFYNEVVKEQHDELPQRNIQAVQNVQAKIFKDPRLIQKSLHQKQKNHFCSNTFKNFLNEAKKIDEDVKDTNVMSQHQVKQIKEQLHVKVDTSLEELLEKASRPEEQQQILEAYFLKNQSTEESRQISGLMLNGRGNLFLRIFFQPKTETDVQNQYLSNNIFDFSLPEKNYLFLLTYLETSYSKKHFKRVLAHMSHYNFVSDKVLSKVCSLCQTQKLGDTLFKFAEEIKQISPSQMNILLPALGKYKEHQPIVFDLIKLVLEKEALSFEMIKQYTKDLMQMNQPDEFMTLFEKIKIFMLTRKFKSEKELTPEEQIAQQNFFKAENHKQIVKFYTDFITFLNQHKFHKQAKLCFMDQIGQKFQLNKEDYHNGLMAFHDDALQTVKVFNHMETHLPKAIDFDTLQLISVPMAKYNTQMGAFFEKIFKEYLLTAALNTGYVNLTLKLMIQYPKSTFFADFLKKIFDQKIPLTNSSKVLCYKALQADPEEASKSYLKGLIDRLFSDQTKQSIEKHRNKTPEKKQEIVKETHKKEDAQDLEIFKTIMSHQIQYMDGIFQRKGKRKLMRDRSPGWEKFQEIHEELGIKHLKDRK